MNDTIILAQATLNCKWYIVVFLQMYEKSNKNNNFLAKKLKKLS